MNKKVQLYSNCIPVKGVTRSIICDLQLQTIHYIPNSLYELIEEHFGKTSDAIKKAYNNEYDEIIDEYLAYLDAKNCIFFTDHPDCFPPMNLQWDYPYQISNAIIDRNALSSYNIFSVLAQLDHLNCKHIQFRFYDIVERDTVIKILGFLNEMESIISSVELYLHDTYWIQKEDFKDFFKENLRVSQICIHKATESKIIEVYSDKHIIYTDKKIASEIHCGIISPDYFTINLKTFTESQHHNSCLNRKIAVDRNGSIKNCPSMIKDYGNIKSTTLAEVLQNENFTTLWNITKDQIDTCKSCEFRYICTDCRAYTENSNKINSKPLKCGYNPETNIWEDWSKNTLKQTTIHTYGLEEII